MKFLFERLAGDAVPVDPVGVVLDNVQRLLSTRLAVDADSGMDERTDAGEAGSPFDILTCGMPNVVELAAANRPALERYGAHLRALIEHYEPRLREPRVDIDATRQAPPPRLVVSGRIETADGTQSMRFPVELREEE